MIDDLCLYLFLSHPHSVLVLFSPSLCTCPSLTFTLYLSQSHPHSVLVLVSPSLCTCTSLTLTLYLSQYYPHYVLVLFSHSLSTCSGLTLTLNLSQSKPHSQGRHQPHTQEAGHEESADHQTKGGHCKVTITITNSLPEQFILTKHTETFK